MYLKKTCKICFLHDFKEISIMPSKQYVIHTIIKDIGCVKQLGDVRKKWTINRKGIPS